MKFYTENQIVRLESEETLWGYFYEAKDLTKHPFLDKYRDELIDRIRRDRDNYLIDPVRAGETPEEEYPQAFAKLFEREIRLVTVRSYWGGSGFYDIIGDANVTHADITKNFKWVVLKYVQRKIDRLEDLRNVAADLVFLEVAKKPKFKRKLEELDIRYDINKYKDASDLAFSAEVIRDSLSAPESKPTIEELLADKELDVHYEDSKIVVYALHSSRACEVTGSPSWCTTSWAFKKYSEKGQLYTVHVKAARNKMFHLHFENFEFTDENNEPIREYEAEEYRFDKVFPGSVFDWKSGTQIRVKAMLENINVIETIGWNSDEMVQVITKKPTLLRELEEIMLVMEDEGEIPRPVLEAALKADENAIFGLEYLSTWHHEIIVRYDPMMLVNIFEHGIVPSSDAQSLAVKEKPELIAHSGVLLDEEIQKEVIDDYPEYLSHADREIQKEYITSDPEMIQYLDTPDEELQMLAIRMSDDPDIIKLFNNKVLFSAQAEWDYRWGDE